MLLVSLVLVAAAAPPPKIKVEKRPTISFELFFHDLKVQGQWLRVGRVANPSGEGEWVWKPRGVDANWWPYSRGTWVLTEPGWYWLSDYPWGYVTSHYGYWRRDEKEGWVWLPTGEWSPGNVVWEVGEDFLAWSPQPPPPRATTSETARPAAAGVTILRWRDLERALLPGERIGALRGGPKTLEALGVTSATASPATGDDPPENSKRDAAIVISTTATLSGSVRRWTGPDPAQIASKAARRPVPVEILDTRQRREVLVVARDRTLLVAYHPDVRETAGEIQAFIARKADQYRKTRQQQDERP